MHGAIIAGFVAPIILFASQDPGPPPPPGSGTQEGETAADSPALRILKAADEATRALTSVKYHAAFHGVGALSGRAPVAEGDVAKLRSSEDPALVMIHAEGWFFTINEADRGQVEFIAAFDGENVVRLDPERQRYFTTASGGTGGQVLSAAQTLNMIEYGHATPFSDEINARTQSLEGRTMVGDVLCDVIYVEYDIEGAQAARWCFGVEDHLPRRVERINPDVERQWGATVLTLTNLEVNPEVDPVIFTLAIPEGYQQGRVGGPVPTSAPMNVGPGR